MPFALFKNLRLKNIDAALERDKQQLFSDLETKGIAFLLYKMSSKEPFSPLIEKRRKIEMSFSSEDTASWYAYKYSEKLHSPEDKQELLELLSNQEYSSLKKYIYTCLASLCSNTSDKHLFNFLISKVSEEEDESTKTSILSRLEPIKKDATYDIEPIKALAKEGTAYVSRAAIKALSNSNDPEVEDILLNEFKIADKHMKSSICGPLSTVGTAKSIPVLKEEYKKTRDQSLRHNIDYAICAIENRERQ